MPVDDRAADARLARDALDRDGVEPALGDDRLRDVEQLLAAGSGGHADGRVWPSSRSCYRTVSYGNVRTHASATDTMPRSISRSSAPASPACAWRSSCARPAWTTSWCSSAARRSAAPGGSTPIPAARCDIPSHLYSFSFAPNPDWTRTYSRQAEIEAYLQRVAEDFDVERFVRLGTTVTGADWDEDEQRWNVETDRGDLSARVLVSAPAR